MFGVTVFGVVLCGGVWHLIVCGCVWLWCVYGVFVFGVGCVWVCLVVFGVGVVWCWYWVW